MRTAPDSPPLSEFSVRIAESMPELLATGWPIATSICVSANAPAGVNGIPSAMGVPKVAPTPAWATVPQNKQHAIATSFG